MFNIVTGDGGPRAGGADPRDRAARRAPRRSRRSAAARARSRRRSARSPPRSQRPRARPAVRRAHRRHAAARSRAGRAIGVDYAGAWAARPLRFWWRDHPAVSRVGARRRCRRGAGADGTAPRRASCDRGSSPAGSGSAAPLAIRDERVDARHLELAQPRRDLGLERAVLGEPHHRLVLGEPQRRAGARGRRPRARRGRCRSARRRGRRGSARIFFALTREVSQTSVAAGVLEVIEHADLEVVGGGQPLDEAEEQIDEVARRRSAPRSRAARRRGGSMQPRRASRRASARPSCGSTPVGQ